MAKLNLDDLRKLREIKKEEIKKREVEGKDIEVIVGMGTCGIAAGAKESVDSFIEEIEKKKIGNVIIKQTGCMGFCASEPTVEVRVPGMPSTIYGNVSKAVAAKIVDEHIVNHRLVSDHVFDKPSIDILK